MAQIGADWPGTRVRILSLCSVPLPRVACPRGHLLSTLLPPYSTSLLPCLHPTQAPTLTGLGWHGAGFPIVCGGTTGSVQLAQCPLQQRRQALWCCASIRDFWRPCDQVGLCPERSFVQQNITQKMAGPLGLFPNAAMSSSPQAWLSMQPATVSLSSNSPLHCCLQNLCLAESRLNLATPGAAQVWLG